MIIGIDLGTTNSLAACLTEDGPKLIPNALGHVLTPSVVGVDRDGHVLVGAAAKELQVLSPERCASAFKRQMGSDWSVKLVKHDFDPVKLSSLVLKTLKQDAEAFLQKSVDAAVITVPAYFNEPQRQATIQAGEMAGLDVARILNEPTAAALAYGLHEFDAEKVALVFDLGGGTFDVSIVDQFEGSLEIRSSCGETFLGGEDFTNGLVGQLLRDRGHNLEHAELKTPRLVSRLRSECEKAKRQLASNETANIRIPNDEGKFTDESEVATVSRADFDRWTERILARTELPLRRALNDARLERSDIDEVLLVGGATRMQAISEHIERLFQCKPQCRINPDEVVAIGAAIQSGLISEDETVQDLVVTDVAPFTLGIATAREIGGVMQDGYFSRIIDRNTVIPVSRVETFSTVYPNQRVVNIAVYQGESRKTQDNQKLGQFELSGIPPGPRGQSFEVRFTYDLNGVLEVEASIPDTKIKANYVVTRLAKGLSEKDIKKAVKQMQALKTHPREEVINRYLLRRAERVFQELSFHEREMLEMLLTGFEEALEMRDPNVIAEHRQSLEQFLNNLETGFDQPNEWSPDDNQ